MSDNFSINKNFIYCKKCFTPNSRPRIKFNKNGICNACQFYDSRKKNVNFAKREKELSDICDKYRSSNSNYDCIVPWSGGKDSSAIAFKLKKKYGMNPLLVTFSPILETSVGRDNRKEIRSLGFDNLIIAPDININKYLSKRFFIERGDPKVHWTAGMKAAPIKTALEKNIKLIFYAENGECFYGGNTLHKDAEKKAYIEEIIENKIGDHPINWVDDIVSEKDLNPYLLPTEEELNNLNIHIYYFAYFENWDVQENFNFISSKCNFLCHEDGRTPGTFTNYDSLDDHLDQVYYYLQLLKFGFGRAARDASRLIQQSNYTREQLKDEVKKFDTEVPEKDIKIYCDYISITLEEFYNIANKHRDLEIWNLSGNDWKLNI